MSTIDERRAADLLAGETFVEPGMDPIKIVGLETHGDTVLIDGLDVEFDDRPIKVTLDRDIVVTVVAWPED